MYKLFKFNDEHACIWTIFEAASLVEVFEYEHEQTGIDLTLPDEIDDLPEAWDDIDWYLIVEATMAFADNMRIGIDRESNRVYMIHDYLTTDLTDYHGITCEADKPTMEIISEVLAINN